MLLGGFVLLGHLESREGHRTCFSWRTTELYTCETVGKTETWMRFKKVDALAEMDMDENGHPNLGPLSTHVSMRAVA